MYGLHPMEPNPEESRIGNLSVVIFENRFWQLTPHGVAVYWDRSGGEEKETDQKLLSGTIFLRRTLAEVMNLGVLNLEIGEIRWSGDGFEGFYAPAKQSIQGRLTESDQGWPESMEIHYSHGTSHVTYLTRYSYDEENESGFLPMGIRRVQNVDAREIERSHISVLEFRPLDGPLDEFAFVPDQIIARNHLELSYYTNGMYYVKTAGGKLKRLKAASNVGGRHGHLWFYTVAGAVTVAIFISGIRTRKMNAENNHQSIERK
jgi:hypothetical protein